MSIPPTASLGGVSPPPPLAADAPVGQAKLGNKLRARTIGAERTIGKVLRTGAIGAVSLFGASVALEALPCTQPVNVAIDVLRKAGLVVLLVTPLTRLTAAGAVLAIKGEWRYALYGAGVLLLLGIALGAGFGV